MTVEANKRPRDKKELMLVIDKVRDKLSNVINQKDFIIRLKTVSVDVDSKGHSCKERMMSVLCQQQNKMSEITRFVEFEKRHLENKEELKSLFKQARLGELYNEHITQLYGGHT